jgi:hypothetical protein
MALPDDAIVVRGGVGAAETIAVNAQTTFDTDGFWGVSGFSAPGLDTAEIARIAHDQNRLNHAQIRTSTARRLREAGFEIQETPDDFPHADILMGDHDAVDDTWELLATLFDAPVANPSLSNQDGAE